MGQGNPIENRQIAAKPWSCALELDDQRRTVGGSATELVAALAAGADLRIYTEFHHHEHIDVNSANHERIQEVAQFGVTCVIDQRWAAGFMSLRQPVSLPDAFGAPASLSLFLYNQDGKQAVARLILADDPADSEVFSFPGMRKMHCHSVIDAQSHGPALNFVYDFDLYRFWVQPRWTQVLENDAAGRIVSGDLAQLVDAFSSGAHVKVAVRELCADLTPAGDTSLPHEVFVECHSCYYHTQQRVFVAASQPLPRCHIQIPMQYTSGGWDYSWLVVRTDGRVVCRRFDPTARRFTDHSRQLGLRWFVA